MNNRFQRGRRVIAFVAGLGAAVAVSVAAPAAASAAPSTTASPTFATQPAKGAPASTPDATSSLVDWSW
ncbi:hypothetical protein ACXR2U_11315 [Jatrophihabitans sp. YIM 134969]